MYWLARIVKYEGSGAPERAYAKWLVLHHLWEHVHPLVRSRPAADAFRAMGERNRWSDALHSATDQTYRSVIDFYRRNRGAGREAIDVSNFFYRTDQHTRFRAFWRGGRNLRRGGFKRYLARFARELAAASE
jgi:hypothetical protein